jgi:tetratricopeptide (TPR) repeat protein
MLRLFFISLLLLVTMISSAQSDTLVKQFVNKACDCFGEISAFKVLSEESFTECISDNLERNNDLIMKECLQVYGDTTEETAYKFGKQLFENIKVRLVDDCYDYFIFMDSLRSSAWTDQNEDSLKRELKWFNSKNKAPDSSIFYTDLGILKLQLKDISGAYLDLNKAVQLQEDNISAHLFRGWALEMQKDYAKAISDFQYVADTTGDSNYDMIVAIVKRKKRIAEGIKK